MSKNLKVTIVPSHEGKAVSEVESSSVKKKEKENPSLVCKWQLRIRIVIYFSKVMLRLCINLANQSFGRHSVTV